MKNVELIYRVSLTPASFCIVWPTRPEETLLFSSLYSFTLSSHSLTFPPSSAFCFSIVFDISCLPVSFRLACSQQQIMRDRWMNVGYEEEELKPYIEPQPDYKDPRRTGGHRSTLQHDKCIPFMHRHTWVQMFSTQTQGWFILRRIMDLQEAHHCNYKLVLCVQTSCCRWDSHRRRSRTRWWTRSTMMWWLHICYWTIGTLRYSVSFSHLHASVLHSTMPVIIGLSELP